MGFGGKLVYGFSIVMCVIMFGLLVLTLVVSVSNEMNRIDAGIIVDKTYTPAHNVTHIQRSGNVSIPITRHADASYTFTIEREKDGKTVQYCFAVTEEEYNSYKIGDYYKR